MKKEQLKTRKPWTHQTGEFVLWSIPNMRHIVKQEFLAHVARHKMTCAGLMEDVLRDYLASQGIYVTEGSRLQPPLPPPFSKAKKEDKR